MSDNKSLLIKSMQYRLFQRFYSHGKAVVGAEASSHWQQCTRHFDVQPVGEDDFDLLGHGFGTSSYNSLPARVFAWIGNTIHLAYLKMPGLQKDINDSKKIIYRMGLVFSQDAFRQVCTLNLLANRMQNIEAPNRILIIGDGHGILSALLHVRYPNARIFLADLGSVLFFQAYYLHRAFPDALQSITDEYTVGNDNNAVFNFCPADRLDTLPQGKLCLAINVASMQEMDPSVTAGYFSMLRRRKTRLFYCCNRLEKHLKGGEVTRFMDYPWSAADEHLVDELCPWHQWFFGIESSSPHVKFCGFPVPFMHLYDGPHWHRLTRLEGELVND